jgi:hypothetical protein
MALHILPSNFHPVERMMPFLGPRSSSGHDPLRPFADDRSGKATYRAAVG